MANQNNETHKPTKEEADKKLESIKPESAGGMSTDEAQFDPNTGKAPGVKDANQSDKQGTNK